MQDSVDKRRSVSVVPSGGPWSPMHERQNSGWAMEPSADVQVHTQCLSGCGDPWHNGSPDHSPPYRFSYPPIPASLASSQSTFTGGCMLYLLLPLCRHIRVPNAYRYGMEYTHLRLFPGVPEA